MADYRQMWLELGLDLERHDALLCAIPALYQSTYLSQRDRPRAMDYFDFVVSEIHGLRVKELVDHKARGGKVFGTFCIYVPEELVLAAGGISVGLCAGAELSIGTAEEVLPRNICPLIKAAFGFRLERICPYFQASDLIVGETTCDGKKKVWEILADYAPVYVMEVPQRKGTRAEELWYGELLRFKDRVEEVTGNKVTAEGLSRAVALADAKRAALERLYSLRKADPSPISGLDALLVMQVSFYDDPARFTRQTNLLCDELEQRVAHGSGVAPKGAPRVLVAGSPMAIPNWKLHSVVEKAGAVVVCEESCTGTRSLTGPTSRDGQKLEDMLSAIARRQLRANCACFTPNDERVDDIIRLSREYGVDGVIHYALQFCQPYMLESVKVRKALAREGVPLLTLETDYGDGDVGQLTTRVEAFLEMTGSRGRQIQTQRG
ncbi:MAG: double-cubane-cluster-containing anaerobic reductase [Chloroflexota bacterium]